MFGEPAGDFGMAAPDDVVESADLRVDLGVQSLGMAGDARDDAFAALADKALECIELGAELAGLARQR